MTWENLTADADALREYLGFEKWAVLGHSFSGHVALEYALRYPDRVSHLVLLDTGGDRRWARENGLELLAQRGCSPAKVELVRRWFRGEFSRREYYPISWRISGAYSHGSGWLALARELAEGGWRSRMRPEALIFAGRQLLDGWSVMDRLGEIRVPTLVMAGRKDFVFPPECQQELAAGIAGSQLVIIDGAGHNPQDEQRGEVIGVLRTFLAGKGSVCLRWLAPRIVPTTLTGSGMQGLGGRIAMAHIAGEITIDAPVDEVFDMVADERNEPRYNPRIVRAEKVSEGSVGRGARFVAEPKGMGSKGEMTLEIVEYDRPRRLRNLVRSSYMQVDGTLTFEGVDGGTRLRWDWDMGLVGPMRVLSPMLAVIGPGWERRNWVGLKEYMESGRR
jgi:proline iminopeptidase